MLDLNEVYGEPRSITLPFLRSFMNTYQVGIRNREANSSAVRNMFVKAFSVEHAAKIAEDIVKPYDMIVKDVISPGSEIYGDDNSGDADYLPAEPVEQFAPGGPTLERDAPTQQWFGTDMASPLDDFPSIFKNKDDDDADSLPAPTKTVINNIFGF